MQEKHIAKEENQRRILYYYMTLNVNELLERYSARALLIHESERWLCRVFYYIFSYLYFWNIAKHDKRVTTVQVKQHWGEWIMDILPLNFRVLWFCGAWSEVNDNNLLVRFLSFCYRYDNRWWFILCLLFRCRSVFIYTYILIIHINTIICRLNSRTKFCFLFFSFFIFEI